MVRELQGAPEPDLAEVIAWLDPCDLVIVEGYKRSPIPKIEVRRSAAASRESLAEKSPNVIAIAADHAVTDADGLPTFALDDVAAIADFILTSARLGPERGSAT
jgi:molybdopterin-guanine dinucleotide biosynthesis protein B